MNKILLCMLLMITGCVTAQSDRPYSPELVLTVEEDVDWLHGQSINFKTLKKDVLVARPVQKYSYRGKLNKDTIALAVGQQLSFVEKETLEITLSNEYNTGAVVVNKDSEFVITGSYTIVNKYWWDRLDSYNRRMLIVENSDKDRFVLRYALLSFSNKPELYDTDSGRLN